MKKVILSGLKFLGVWGFWLLIWFLLSLQVNSTLLLPSPIQVFRTLGIMLATSAFWKNLALSLLRVFGGILLSLLLGTLLAILTSVSSIARALLTPAINAMKSVPVACFIVLVFLWMNTATIPILITSLIVIPIVWSNVSQGIASTDRSLCEVTSVYGFSPLKKCTALYIPTVFPYFLAACRSALGMAWKAEIAAEVLAPPLLSGGIGLGIYFAKTHFESAELFAWTLVIVLVSYAIEKLLLFALKKLALTLHLSQGGSSHAEP